MKVNECLRRLKLDLSLKEGGTNYLTHNFHIYPAKFIPQIPRTTIKCLTNIGDTVLDPFCGCGTTAVECKLLNRNSIGLDINPIAILVAKTKTTKLNKQLKNITSKLLDSIKKDISEYYDNGKASINYKLPEFYNRDHWFQNNVLHELAIIKQHIIKLKNNDFKNYFLTAFSAIIVKISNQESDTRFAAIDKNIPPFKTYDEFKSKVLGMNPRILKFIEKASDAKVNLFEADSQDMKFIKNNSIDHIVTSPPYANTYDYYLYHKFRMYWLDYDVKSVQEKEIGSRDKHSSKKEEITTFIDSLTLCLSEMNRVLKPKKYAVMVIGDSVIRGKLIKSNEIINDISNKTNFKVCGLLSYNLKKNTKTFNPSFTNKNKMEHIIFMKNIK